MSLANDAFIRYKSRHAVTWSLCNLQRIAGHPCATSLGRPLAGRTAIVVGAGYALTRNGEHLRAAQRAGAAIIGTNSSAPILAHYGVQPDAIVVRESIDNSAEIASSDARLVCVDICAHPRIWDAAGERLAWFAPGYGRHFDVCQLLGVRPLFGGTAAFTSAVALAREWGAARIALAGAGMAMEAIDGELRPYHPEAPRGTLRGILDGDAVRFSGNEANDAIAIASGQQPQPVACAIEWLPAHDYRGRLPALHTLCDEHGWLETEATRHGARIELVNASEGGAGVVGWRNERLVDVLPRIEDGAPITLDAGERIRLEAQEALTLALRAEADELARLTSRMLSPAGPQLHTLASDAAAQNGSPLVEALAAWRLVDVSDGPALERCRTFYGALQAAARDALGVLHGDAPEAA